jgi:integrase
LSHDHYKRVRYNRGMLCKEKRASGTVWVFRWSEELNGRRRQHKDVIGTTKQFPTEAAANKEADRLRLRLNENKQFLSLKSITFGELINHYLDHELPRLSKSARIANKSYIKNWIEPAWYGHLADRMKTMQIQEWLDKIQHPDGTKLKIKNVLSTIFSHGVRWELVQRNPVCGQGGTPGHRGASTGVRQSNRVWIRRVILPPEVVRQTLEQLPLRETTMSLVAAVTALRASELIALQWKNVGWDTGILQSQFAFVEGELKETKSRNNALPLAEPVLQVLRLWRDHTPYRSDEDWIFASPHYHGKTPYTYQILFRRHIRPVIEKISGLRSSKQAPIGWHTLRRSLATLLISNGENVKVAQSQLRHTTPKITLELYAQAVSADQQKAHNKVVQMVLPMSFSEKLKARSATSTV